MVKKKNGFTLIELLVVIVIIGILATIGVAQFNTYQEKARQAKSIAFASQIDHVLMAETSATGYGFPLRLDFDEGTGTTATDSSGSGNDLEDWTGKNVIWSSETPDNSSYSLAIDTEVLEVDAVKNMPEDAITFSGFVFIDEFSTSNTFPFFVNWHAGFTIHNDGLTKFYINGTTSGIGNGKKIKLNRWHHLLGSYKDGKLRFFVDGDLVEEVAVTQTVFFNDSNADLRMGYVEPGREFKGKLDRVRIYPVGLDPSSL